MGLVVLAQSPSVLPGPVTVNGPLTVTGALAAGATTVTAPDTNTTPLTVKHAVAGTPVASYCKLVKSDLTLVMDFDGTGDVLVKTAGVAASFGVRPGPYSITNVLGGLLVSGAGAPPTGVGEANGDFYFRTDGGALTTLYQRRAGAWVGIV